MTGGLRIPGPVPLHSEVAAALRRPMISYRGPEMRRLLDGVVAGLSEYLGASRPPLLLTGSGTGAMEASLVNTLSPGDRVVGLGGGQFGERFLGIARAFGLDVRSLGVGWGEPASPERLREVLRSGPGFRAVLLTHCETSTGVLHPVAELLRVVRAESDALALVDAVSSLGAVPLDVDACDVVFTGSQKAWGLPPGMAMVWTSERAEAAGSAARLPRFYWNFATLREAMRRGTMPFTPSIPVLFALEAGVRLMLREGRDAGFARHERAAALVRRELAGMDLALVAPPGFRSPTVTAAWLPDGTEWSGLSDRLAARGVTLAGGLGEFAGRILRFGHMGWMTAEELRPALGALAESLVPPAGAS